MGSDTDPSSILSSGTLETKENRGNDGSQNKSTNQSMIIAVLYLYVVSHTLFVASHSFSEVMSGSPSTLVLALAIDLAINQG